MNDFGSVDLRGVPHAAEGGVGGVERVWTNVSRLLRLCGLHPCVEVPEDDGYRGVSGEVECPAESGVECLEVVPVCGRWGVGGWVTMHRGD